MVKKIIFSNAQVMLEFSFVMIMVFLFIFGTAMIFHWSGIDFGRRQATHDQDLVTPVVEDYGQCTLWCGRCSPQGQCFDCSFPLCGRCECRQWDKDAVLAGPMKQLNPNFYRPVKMNAVWDGFDW